MKSALFFLIALLLVQSGSAQLTKEQRIQDSVLGWWSKFPTQPPKEIKTKVGILTVKEQENMRFLISCMMKTYTPVGGLGYFKINKNGSVDGVQQAYRPNSSWIDFRVWDADYDYLDDKGNFKPVPEQYTRFPITINDIPASYPIYFLNTPTQYYFTWPPDGYMASEYPDNRKKNADPRIHPNVYKFITRINEDQIVLLAPGNKLPFREVTIGEYLTESEKAMDRNMAIDQERRAAPWPGDDERDKKNRADVYEYVKKEYDRFRAALQKLKEKYKDRYNEPAILHNMQPTVNSEYYGDMDPFAITAIERQRKQYYPVYKVDAALLEKCKSDKPQWIAFDFPYETRENGNQLYELYTSLTENFNYDYVYNYFFDPEKVKGQTYKPVNEAALNARLDAYRKKYADIGKAPTVSYPPNVHFMEDFASSGEGAEPKNWFFKKYGKHAVVVTPKDEKEKWLQLGYGTPVSPIYMKKPLPDNFTLEFDLKTDPGFPSRYGGSVILILNSNLPTAEGVEAGFNNGSRVTVEFTAGNESEISTPNFGGGMVVRINSNPSDNKEHFEEGLKFETPLRLFTDKKTRIHVAVQNKDGRITVMVNDKVMADSKDFKMTYGGACVTCGVPKPTRFNSIYWNNTTNDADNVKVYITNVKISKS